MFEFRNLEQVEGLAKLLGSYYCSLKDIYKEEHQNRFYLLVRKSEHTPEKFNKECNVISEYAVAKKYSQPTEAFFLEHGKRIIKGNALQVMSELG